jgi:serine/threonine protein kinase
MTSTQKGTLKTGTLVGNGRFKIIKFLGAGAFGETYLAKDTHDFDSENALKLFSFARGNPNTFNKAKELFDREAKVLKELTESPQNNLIPRYKAYFSDNQDLYLAQEFINGDTLRQELRELLKNNKRFNEDETAKLLDDVLNALYFIHSKGKIHRDIKPENLIRRKSDGRIFLIDFGAVKEKVTQVVTPDTKIHTDGYAPPEQMQGKVKYYSDIYALGMTALEALTGVEPEKLKDATEKVVWPSQVQVSDKLKKILEKMVEHNYKHRYKSAEEVLQALKSAGFRTTLVVAPKGQSTLLSGVFPMWLWFVVAVPLVAILAFFVPLMVRSIFTQHPTQPETPKPGDVKSPKPTHKPSDDQRPPVKRSPKPETPQPKNVQSPTPTPEPSDDDIFKRPPGTP